MSAIVSSQAAHPRAGGENRGLIEALGEAQGSSPRGRGKLGVLITTSAGGGLIPARAGKTASPSPSSTARAAHPRAGGENATAAASGDLPDGSSPRGRGKLGARRRRDGHDRLIPARAGKTTSLSASPTTRRAHPRAGGENLGLTRADLAEIGSSPRGRGKPDPATTALVLVGLIPARAGKTTAPTGPSTQRPAHPRAGGENSMSSSTSASMAGSSPRGRGKPIGNVVS